MAVHSIFGDAAPTGSHVVYFDGFNSIWLAQAFRRGAGAGPLTDASQCVGTSILTPVGVPAQIMARVWVVTGSTTSIDPDVGALQSKMVDTVPGNETVILWDEPVTVPEPGEGVLLIAYQFREVGGAGGSADDCYVFTNGMPHATAIQSGTAANLFLSEFDQGAFGPSTLLRINSGTFNPASSSNTGYGIDVLVDDLAVDNTAPTANAGLDQTVLTGSLTTLSAASSTDPDGSIAAYEWEQTSGTAVTLAGTGAGRTFTPATPGVRTFTVTVTDDDGATATDTVQITVNDPGETPTVAEENALDGTPRAEWYNAVDVQEVPGFARALQIEPGDTVEFSVDYPTAYSVLIHRLGWYAENEGARLVASFPGTPTDQPAPVVIPDSNGAVTCAAWTVTDTWDVPEDATPGWYYALLRNAGATDFGHIIFCVGDSTARRSVLMVGSDPTWGAAYNGYGGNNVYGDSEAVGVITNRALCSTYDKPIITREHVPATHFLNGEYPVLRFLERFGVDVGYATHEAIEADPTILDGRDLVVFAGHNEYVSQVMHDTVASLLNDGNTRVLNLAANDFFWRIRFGTTDDGDTTRGRVMWARKDTMPGPGSHVAGVPFVSGDWQGTWQDTRQPGGSQRWARFADTFIANGIRSDQVRVPYAMKDHPLWRDCDTIAALTPGQEHGFGAGTLGFEWDRPDTSPPGVLVPLSATTVDLENFASDVNGQSYTGDGVYTHAVTAYRAGPGSGIVLNWNTCQWGWALDDLHLRGTAVASTDARQATLNVLADLGAPPVAGLVTAAGLTVPEPVVDLATAYGLTVDADEGGVYYSDGTTWTLVTVHTS